MEPRILFSADGLSALLDPHHAQDTQAMDVPPLILPPAHDTQAQHAAPPVAQAAWAPVITTELVVVDARVADYQRLVEDIQARSTSDAWFEIIVLNQILSGIEQITDLLAQRHDVSAVHIVSHGAQGGVQLGADWIDDTALQRQADALAHWREALTAEADILVYGCDVAEGSAGRAFIDQLATLTGADVAASSDITGSAAFGGDWVLEEHIGFIDTPILLSGVAQGSWAGTLATYTVINTNDSGAGSLRQAILDANANTGADTVTFNIPGTGPHTINVLSALTVTDTVLIDGWSEPDFVNSPMVRIDGGFIGGLSGLTFTDPSDGSTVRGLMITRFAVDGINVATGVDNITIVGNWIGTTGTGSTGVGNNDDGIDVRGRFALIGGAGANERNVIANFEDEGINLQGGAVVTGHVIKGNYIGVDPDGLTSTWNNADVGIAIISGTGNTIGGITPAERNVISNNVEGIEINTSNNIVQGNYIGTDVTGTIARGNFGGHGVQIQGGTTGNVIGGATPGAGNLIAFNSGDGVSVSNGSSHAILGNSIYSNTGQGMDLADDGVTLNDAGDGDGGANNLQNFPLLTSAVADATGTTLLGSLNTTAGNYRIEFFASRPAVADATHGEGERYLGFITLSHGGGTVNFNAALANVWVNSGDRISATATVDLGGGNYASTSEFGANVTASANGIVVVDTTSDATTGSNTSSIVALGANRGTDGRISLREAILATNNTLNGATPDKIVFNIPGTGVQTINVTSQTPIITQAVIIDGYTQPGASVNSLATGNNANLLIEFNGNGVLNTHGLELATGSDGSTIRGMVINRFFDSGIRIFSSNNVIEGNFIGTDATGTIDRGNTVDGIRITGANNTIGGTTLAARNLISGNNDDGIDINSAGATGNRILGNYIGVNASGTAALGNSDQGVEITGATATIVGDGTVDGRNVISGNSQRGVFVVSGGAVANTLIAGNYIGTDAAGNADVGNANHGVDIGNSSGNTIRGNVISGNNATGMILFGEGSDANTVEGNKIGTNAAGTAAIGNSFDGIYIMGGADNNIIGGSTPAARNIISGNLNDGIEIVDSGTTDNFVLGNYIGTDVSGLVALGNARYGVVLYNGVEGTVIGGSIAAGHGNVISGNANRGIQIDGNNNATMLDNTVRGNIIGLNKDGTAALGNGGAGVFVFAGAANTIIGGVNADERNVISSNADAGIFLGTGTTSVTVQGNYIGTDVNGAGTFGNPRGIVVDGINHTIGGTAPGAGNLIANNIGMGVYVVTGATGNAILGNSIHSNIGLGIGLASDGVTPNDPGDGDTGANNLMNFPVIYNVTISGGNVTITGEARPGALVEFFEAALDATGYGEGQAFIGRNTVGLTGTAGAVDPTAIQFSFTFAAGTLVVGDRVTATATDTGNNTSEFAAGILGFAAPPATLIVDTAGDVHDGDTTTISTLLSNKGADGFISLREAIQAVNNTAGLNTINFNIAGAGPHTINLASALPALTDAVVINGASEPDFGGTPIIEINGSGAGVANGLVAATGSAGSTIRGLAIQGFSLSGILVQSSGNTFAGNYLGLDANGNTIIANNTSDTLSHGGIRVESANNVIGGLAVADRNVISGNLYSGIVLFGAGANSNQVLGNYIGTDATGTLDRGNAQEGIDIDGGSSNIIGGANVNARNIISGNDSDGIEIDSGDNNVVQGNYIGTDRTGTLDLGNARDGVDINENTGDGATGNLIGGTGANEGNLIFGNDLNGIEVRDNPTIANRILGNQIFGNGLLGIELGTGDGVTANDGGDADTGPNNLMNFPVIYNVVISGGSVTISGEARPGATVEFFVSPGVAGTNGQAQTFIGRANVPLTGTAGTADGTAIQFSFTFAAGSLVNGDRVTATATTTPDGTSEFAVNVTAAINSAPVNTIPGPHSVAEDNTLAIAGASVNDVNGNLASTQLTVSNGTLNVSLAGGATISAGANGSNTLTLSGTQAQINAALATLSYVGNPNFNGSDSLIVLSTDANGLFDSDTLAITVTAINDAPVASGVASLAAVAEDAPSPGGATVTSLFGATFSDAADAANPGQNQFEGVAVRGQSVNAAQGRWQYSVNGGGSWNNFGALSDTNALGLRTTDLIRFLPAADFNGTPTNLTVRLIDNSFAAFTGSALSGGATVDANPSGGVTPYSAATVTLGTTVSEVNDAPSATADVLTSVAEDSGVRVISFASLLANDSRGPANEVGQTLTITAVSNVVGGTAIINGTDIEFTPAANFNGTASFDYTVQDNGTTNGVNDFKTAVGSVSFPVTPVNDPPVNTVPGAQTVNEDTPLSIAGISVNDVDGNLATTQLSVTNGTLNVSLAGGVTISGGANGSNTLTLSGTQAQINAALATLTYQGNLNFNGADTLTVLSTDGNGVTDSDNIGITVAAQNDAPVNTVPGAQTVSEDTPLAIGGISISDVDGANATTQLTVGNGRLNVNLAGGATIVAGANNTNTLTLSGTQAQINAALGTLAYQGNLNFNGADNLQIVTNDLGNTGAGGPQSDTDTVAITVNAVNDAPVAVVPGTPYSATEQVALNLKNTGLAVSDVDGGVGIQILTLSVGEGVLNVTAGGSGAVVSGGGTNTVTITGNINEINNLLNFDATSTIFYFNGLEAPSASVTLNLNINDGGNTGSGGAQSGSANVAINIAAVNDAPVNTVPGVQTVDEDTPLAIPGLSINDNDAGGANLATQLTVSNGTLNVSLAGGATISAGANGSNTLTLSGTQAQINAALATLTYQGNLNFNGADTLQMVTNDLGNSGTGGALADTDIVAITLVAQNDAPVNTVPGAQTVNEDTPLAIGGISIADVDGASATTQLTVTNGTLNVNLAGGASISAGANNSDTLTLSGTIAQINAALATLIYQGNPDFAGADTLQVLASDLGNTGAGGALTDIDTVAITVTAQNDAPVNTVPGAQTVNEDTPLNIAGMSVNDIDGNLATTRLTVTNGVLNVSLAGGATISAGANASNTLTLSGTQVQINAALATVNYQGNLNFNGADTLTVLSTDGNGASDSDDIGITVTAQNDAPVNTVPGAQTVSEDTPISITGISVDDVDGNLATTQLTVGNGNLTVSLAGGATISAGANGGALLTLSGTQTQINAALATLSYQGNLHFNGADTLTVLSTDGNGATDNDSVAITVTALNDAPVNTVPGAQTVNEDTTINIAGVSVNDVDGNLATTQLSVSNGTLTVGLGGGATISGGANGSSTLTLSGTQAQIDSALATLSYQGNLNYNGPDTLTVTSTDTNSATDVDTVAITVTPQNDAPVNTVPGAQTVNEDAPLNIVGISVNDVDGNLVSAQLSVGAGTLNVSLAGGATIGAGANGSNTLMLNGTQAQINAALATLIYQGNLNFNGADTLTVLSTDGSGATDSDPVAITVMAQNDAPVNSVPGAQTVNEDTPLNIAGIDVNDVDGNLATTRLSVGNGTLSVSLAGGATISGGANGSNTLTLSGTQAQINAVLGTLSYQGNLNFNGSDTLTVLSTDGSGAMDSDAVAITVVAQNDAPMNIVPGAQTVNEDTPLAITGLSVNDVDGDLVSTQLAVGSGTLTVNLAGGAAISAGANGSNTLTLSGTQAQINAALASLNYQGNLNFNGLDTLTVVSSDGGGANDSDTVAINVLPINDAPTATPITLVAIAEDSGARLITQAELLANATDVDGPALNATNLTISSGAGSLVDNGNGTWTYTPALNDDAAVSFGYTVTDGSLTAAGSATLEIAPVNDTPVTAPVTLAAIAEDSGARLITQAELLVNASDVDGPALTATGLTIGSGAGTLLDNGDGTWTYTPAPNDDTSVTFNYAVTDGFATAPASAVLDLTPVNDAATIVGDVSGTVIEAGGAANSVSNSPNVSGKLTASDVDNAPNTFVAQAAVAGTYGTFQLLANGDWTYAIDNNHPAVEALNNGATLTDSFIVQSADGTSQVVTVTVGGANDNAVTGGATSGSVNPAADNIPGAAIATGQLTAADWDNPSNTFQAIALTASAYGSYQVAVNGVWTYVLDTTNPVVQALRAGNALTDAFTVLTADGTPQVVTVTIGGEGGQRLGEAPRQSGVPDLIPLPNDPVRTFDSATPSEPQPATSAASAAARVIGPLAETTDVFGTLGADAESTRRGLTVSPQTALVLQSGMGFISRLALVARQDDVSMVFAGYDFGEYTFQLGRLNLLQQATGRGADNGGAALTLPEHGGANGGAQDAFNLNVTLRAAGISLTLGIAAWALRSGGLLAAMLSSLPAWRQVDLLPILGDPDKRKAQWEAANAQANDETAREERAVNRLLGDRAGAHKV